MRKPAGAASQFRGSAAVFQAGPTDSTGSITYRCGNSDHNIRIAISAGSRGSFTNRTLKNGSGNLLYNLLYGRFTQVWGDGTGGTTTYFENNRPNNRTSCSRCTGASPARRTSA